MQQHSLVLYKNRAAYVTQLGIKLEIATIEGKKVKVRHKDVIFLHPGPLWDFSTLQNCPTGDIQTAWELIAGQRTTLKELCELIYGTYTPATAWATWELTVDGLYFQGTPDDIIVLSVEDVTLEQTRRTEKEAEEAQWEAFTHRINQAIDGQIVSFLPAEQPYLQELEEMAHDKKSTCHVLALLNKAETPENAQSLLLSIGYWQPEYNPYLERYGIEFTLPTNSIVLSLPNESRQDLTYLPAFAIDDHDSHDPDDAISIEGNRLWVHIADVAAVVETNSPADLEARARATNVYLPEGVIPMLPPNVTDILGLGLQDTSPALSIGIDIDEDTGKIIYTEIVLSQVKVTRLTYEEANTQLEQGELHQIYRLTQSHYDMRCANGAIEIHLPEVKVRLGENKEIHLWQLPYLQSRQMVREAMLIAGQAVGQFAITHNIPVPFSTQPEPTESDKKLPDGLAGMFAIRRTLKPGKRQVKPNPHIGLGLSSYVQTTSPLRRYLDLVVHQQLRAFLAGQALLTQKELVQRIGSVAPIVKNVRRATRLSNRYWTLVYLMRHPNWEGEGVVVEVAGNRNTVIIPALALETSLYTPRPVHLNKSLQLRLKSVILPKLDAHFEIKEM